MKDVKQLKQSPYFWLDTLTDDLEIMEEFACDEHDTLCLKSDLKATIVFFSNYLTENKQRTFILSLLSKMDYVLSNPRQINIKIFKHDCKLIKQTLKLESDCYD